MDATVALFVIGLLASAAGALALFLVTSQQKRISSLEANFNNYRVHVAENYASNKRIDEIFAKLISIEQMLHGKQDKDDNRG